MRVRMKRRNYVKPVPALLTLANGVCGFAAIIFASRVHTEALYSSNQLHAQSMIFLEIAGWLIFGGMFFDVLDGRVARMANTASKFGAELDSLCDAISFGAAPAFLLLKLGPTPDRAFLYKILFIAATFYVICTILRLARFNVETALDEESHRFFKGLPSPAAAGCIATIAILRSNLGQFADAIDPDRVANFISNAMPFAAMAIASLMVSTVRYPHLVNQTLRGRRKFNHLVTVVLLVLLIAVLREMVLALAFWGFATVGLVRWTVLRFAGAPAARSTPNATDESLTA